MTIKRIVACLDIIGERVVVGEQFKNLQDVESPLTLAAYYENSQVDDLVIYDISGKDSMKSQFLQLIKQIRDITTMPLTVGGGIKTLDDISNMLAAGADRISINSTAINDRDFLPQAIEKFGGDVIVLAIDAKEIAPNKWHAFTAGGKKDSGLDIFDWAKETESLGVAEIVLNSIDSDGAKQGFALQLNEQMAQAVNIPVIASGGAGDVTHFSEIFKKTKVAGALAASIFHQKLVTIADVKQHLQDENMI